MIRKLVIFNCIPQIQGSYQAHTTIAAVVQKETHLFRHIIALAKVNMTAIIKIIKSFLKITNKLILKTLFQHLQEQCLFQLCLTFRCLISSSPRS